MKEDTVTKIGRVSDLMEQSKPLRWMKHLNACCAYLSLLVVLATGGLYVYERLLPTSASLVVDSVVSSKAEYEYDEPISFFIVSALSGDAQPTFVDTTLRCDAHDGAGDRFISNDHVALNWKHGTGTDMFRNIQTFKSNVGVSVTYNQISTGLRKIVSSVQAPVEYKGALPSNSASTCYADMSFETYTPIFKIPVQINKQSYPFEYITYGSFGDEHDDD